MKVAVSIPDDVFAQAEALAGELRLSRSGMYARALREYLDRRTDDATARMNSVIDELGGNDDLEWSREAARQVFSRTEW